MKPEDVKSPQDRLDGSTLEVIFSTGDDGYAIATMSYKGWDATAHEPRVGIRWNGADDAHKGNPTSSGMPTWFILPREIGLAVEALVNAFANRIKA